MAETYPNRFYQHAARPTGCTTAPTSRTLPTIWDRLAAPGVSGTLLLQRHPVHRPLGRRSTSRISQAVRAVPRPTPRPGTLPAVSLRRPALHGRGRPAPRATTTRTPTSAPGEAFLNQVYDAVTTRPGLGEAPCWSSTTTSGAASSTTSPRARRPTSRPTTALRGFRVPAAGDLAAGAARPRRPPHLRPHLGAAR